MKQRTEAWKESLKRIEDGEQYEKRLAAKYKKTGPWAQTTPATHVMHYRAVDAVNHLAALAGALDDGGCAAAAVEIRRFMFDVVEPHTGRQCQS